MLVFHGTIILVIDGARSSIFRNRAHDFSVDLEPIGHSTRHAARTAEVGSDRPGRSFSSVGSGRSAYETTDLHQGEEDDFAKVEIAKLNTLAKHAETDFIIVAAPHVLGTLRQHYSDDLKKRLLGEIDKDFAGRPPSDIAKLLLDYAG